MAHIPFRSRNRATARSPFPRSLGARLTPLAGAALLALPAGAVWAQATPGVTAQALPAVTVTGRATPPASITGFGDEPLARTPIQATVISSTALQDAGVDTLAGITRFDASVSDAYNSAGYWSILKVRGYTLDNRFNYRRDGLPINAETALSLVNKDRVEILKGTSGMQAGTSAPGGLVNLVVKRPDVSLRRVTLGYEERGSYGASVDLSERFGDSKEYGLRVNADVQRLDPLLRNATGQNRTLSVAGDWRATPDTLVEAEVESSRHRQPSQPAFSMLGNTVPSASSIDPRTNLNNQPWSQPVVLAGNTASLRVTQKLNADWSVSAHAMSQRLKSDDRVAFPFGCTAADGTYYADRYCPDGTYDLYDFRSDGERRNTDVLKVGAKGQVKTGDLAHQLSADLMTSRYTQRMGLQAYNYVGTGNIAGTAFTPPDPGLTGQNTNRTERSTELALRDIIQFTPEWSAWLGLRHTRLNRESVLTDGTQPTQYAQAFTTPWLAVGWQLNPQTLLYASTGQGIESDVVPNRSRYTNAGQALPAQRSRQLEAGIKQELGALAWSANVFNIERPAATDSGSCDVAASCTRVLDGVARHRGLEASADWRDGAWSLRGSTLLLQARREGATVDASLNGKRPPDVPEVIVKLNAAYLVPQLPGLTVAAGLNHEGSRMVLPDNSASIPAWTTLDLTARYTTALANGTRSTWRLGLDNATNRRAWRESPYQYDHAFLFPLAPRTLRASVQFEL